MIDYQVTGGVAELTLNAPPANAINSSMLEKLGALIRRAGDEESVCAVTIRGSSGQFSAGADIKLFQSLRRPEDAIALSRSFQDAFQVVEDSAKPVVAVMTGKVMGGALELAMACHLRVCDESTLFSMPEVRLGINPGAGGTQRLPRLIGVEKALRMMLGPETVNARQALEAGLVDAVCAPGEVAATLRGLLGEAGSWKKTAGRDEKIRDREANAAALVQGREQAARGPAEIIAPAKILEAVECGLNESVGAGFAREREVFAECMETLGTQNKIYLFFASRSTGKISELENVAGAAIERPAVVGTGTMGAGIVQALLMRGLPVLIWDREPEMLEACRKRIEASLEKLASQGRLSADRLRETLGRLTLASAWKDLAQCDLVIESVFERLDVKRAVLTELESVCPSETLLASNTSTLSLDLLAEKMAHPDRLIGLHFFNPAHRMPLVEVIRRDATPDPVTATALRFARTLRKTPVLVRNREGFLVNRLFIPYLKEAFALLEEGAPAPAIDRAMTDFGFPMGPLTLIDMAGLDIMLATDTVLEQAFPYHGPLSPVVARLVEAGHLGQKTGSGVYRYERGSHAALDSDTASEIIAAVREDQGREPREISGEEITGRLVMRMVAEAFRVLEEGLVSGEADIDTAMVLGTGFPDYRGGVCKYARDSGMENVREQLRVLSEEFGERFAV